MSGATVTPSGVREGDPAALTALSAVRGPSVLAYCRHVAGEADAGAAAAEAFARFRVAVVAAGDTASLNPEALLVGATRTSAAARAGTPAEGDCADVPVLLAERAEKTITVADLERLESHLEQCWACRAPVARFKAAERAYRDPPEKTIDPAVSAEIVAALVAAVPPPAPPEPQTPAFSANGSAEDAAGAPPVDPHATQAFAIEQPTEHFAAPGMIEPDAAAAADAAVAAPSRRRRPRKPAGAGALLSRLRPTFKARGPRERPQPAAPAAPRQPVAPRALSGRARPVLRPGVVVPVVLILLALIAALYVSGVFGGNDPASTPGAAVPATESTGTTDAELVAVPGAKDASADAVEKAKARERARERGDAAPAKKKATKKKADDAEPASAPAAAAPPPPAATPSPASPAVSANNPVTRPAPAPDSGSDEPKRIDAGSGATGAEQIPPAADATGIPDLAPPPEPAPTP